MPKDSHNFNEAVRLAGNAQHDIDKIRETAGQVASHQKDSLDHAQSTCKAVAAVAGNVDDMLHAMREIERNVGNAVDLSHSGSDRAGETLVLIENLSQAAEQIGSVVTLIHKIANQTNLLALNAAIEAARAGHAGRGFAVVAGEVKDLAKQTADATDEITERVREIQQTTKQAVDGIGEVAGSTADIALNAQAIKDAVIRQHAATEEMSLQTAEISRMSEVTTSNIRQSLEAAGGNRERAARILTDIGTVITTLQVAEADLAHAA